MPQTKYSVVLLGSGRVALHLVRALAQAPNFTLQEIYARRIEQAEILIQSFGLQHCQAQNELAKLCPTADIYIFSVTDSALPLLMEQMPATRGLWLHTAGSVDLMPLANYHQHCGVLYPLQTFSVEREFDWQDVPIYLETKLEEDKPLLESLALTLSPKLQWINSRQRMSLHCAAVFACNFSNHVIALAQELLEREGLDKNLLLPLITETFNKLQSLPAKEAQTGPALRGDKVTLEKHLDLLQDSPKLNKVYEVLSNNIKSLHQ